MDRDSLRGKVQTVTGVIESSALGKTLMHEHLLCDIRTPTMRQSNVKDPEITLANVFAINYGRMPHYTQYLMDLKDIAVAEMGNMKEVGGNSLVELSCGGLKPDPKGLQDISLATDVNDMPYFRQLLSDEQIADVITYIRTSWGNSGSAVTAAQVAEIREATDPSGNDDIHVLRMK